jgi:hypothetical protein
MRQLALDPRSVLSDMPDGAASRSDPEHAFMDRRAALLTMIGLLTTSAVPLGRASAERAAAPRVELLMFEEAGCPWCRRWRAEVGPGYPHSPEGKRAPLRIIDLHGARPAGIVLADPVRISPTFVLVEDGREVGRIVGYPGPDFFWGLLEGLMRKLKGSPFSPRGA